MPLGVPTQRSAGRVPGPSRRAPEPPPAKPPAATTTASGTTTLLPGSSAPLSQQNPGPAKFYPAGTTPPPPGPLVYGDIPAGMPRPANTVTIKNYGLDNNTWAALNAATGSQRLLADSRNAGLDFDLALAQRGNVYDRNGLGLNYWADKSRLGQSEYRDVDLARFGVQNDATAAGNAYGVNLGRLAGQLQAGRNDFDLGMQSSAYGAGMQRRDLSNQSAAAGSMSATGTAQGFTDIDGNLGFAQQGLRNTWDQVQSNNALDRTSLDNDWATKQADLSRQRATIDSVAKDYGITRSQMEQAFKLGSDRLSLDYATLVKKFTEAKVSNNAQAQAAADALLLQVLSAAQGG